MVAMEQVKKTLEQQKEELKAKQKKEMQQMNARISDSRTKEKLKDRKEETRKKIIVGALALNHMEKNKTSDFAKKINALINEYVVKDKEREIFNLEPLAPIVQNNEKKK